MVGAAAWCASVHYAAGPWRAGCWSDHMGSTGAACAPTRDLGAAIVATRLYRAVYNLLKPGIHFLCALVRTRPLWQGMRKPSPVLQPEVDDPGGRPRRRCRPRANITALHCGDFAVSAMCTRCRRRCVGSPNMDLRSPNTFTDCTRRARAIPAVSRRVFVILCRWLFGALDGPPVPRRR
jgi:hypothetical protein